MRAPRTLHLALKTCDLVPIVARSWSQDTIKVPCYDVNRADRTCFLTMSLPEARLFLSELQARVEAVPR